jgi:type VI secretion system secreted protein VgrG
MKYTQAGRLMAVTTPLGPDVLLLETFQGSETLSGLFHFQLGLLALSTSAVAFDKVLGQSVTVAFPLPGGGSRYFNGIVSRFSEGPQIPGPEGRPTFTRYRAEMVPRFWLLTRQAQSRIFQQMAVPDILKQVLKGLDVSYSLQGKYEPRDYCVQYRETDFAFASRLMEEEGIYYFFKHANGSHTLVVADNPQGHADVPGPTTLIYEGMIGGTREEDRILGWEKTQEVRSGKHTLWDQCFELPGKNLAAQKQLQDSVSVGTVSHNLKAGSDGLEVYDYPGAYAQRFDGVAPGGSDRAADLQKIFQDNDRTVGLRSQEEAAAAVRIEGFSNCRHLAAGHKFTLTRHFDANGAYVLTGVEHTASQEGVYMGTESSPPAYSNRFECLPAALPYRPARRTLRAHVPGTQTAVVVGPQGEEIFTDKYGRVKVQFPWDRQGKNDANSSCWVRVGTLWAGKQWGSIHIPRVGQEVIVAFEEGDPDRPIIVGSVYNADQMPPYKLPDNRTQSGLKTRSSLKGTADNCNELRFEDKKGSEDILFHAEKDFHREVEHDDNLTVGHDQTIEVKNNRTETVKEGNEQITIEKGNRTVSIDTGDDTLTIKTGNQSIKLNVGGSTTEAMQSIVLKVGQSSITIDQTGVTIKGMNITIQGQVQTAVKGTITQINGDAMLQMKGGITMIN